jgi:nucleoside recognition membrane protein YjiH
VFLFFCSASLVFFFYFSVTQIAATLMEIFYIIGKRFKNLYELSQQKAERRGSISSTSTFCEQIKENNPGRI